MKEEIYDCVVVGGGVSGISFAHYLNRRGDKVLVLEKAERAGGQIRTYTSATHPDFWIEQGTHTCYNSYTYLLAALKEAGLQDHLLPLGKGKYKLYVGDRLRSIFSRLSLWQMFLACFRMMGASKKGKAVREFFEPIVGRKNYERLFKRAFRAVICQDADLYPAEFFLKHRRERMKEIPFKYSYGQGLSGMIREWIGKEKINVETEAEAGSIVREGELYRVATVCGGSYLCRNIALAVNPKASAALMGGLAPGASALLNTIPLSHSETLSIIIRKEKSALPLFAGILPVNDDFLSVVSRDLYFHPELRGFSFHFPADGKSLDERVALACRMLGISREDMIEQSSARHVLPSPRKAHIDIIEQLKPLTGDHLFLLGNYFYGLSIEDCVHRSWDEYNRYAGTPPLQ